MRWERGRRSSNIEDRRGTRISRRATGGGIGVLLIALVALYFGVDPSVILNQAGPTMETPAPYATQAPPPGASDTLADFMSAVLADTEDTWHELFRRMGRAYNEPTLVLFSDAVESACGFAQAAMGPFYCPRDQKIYLDLTFFRDLRDRYQAPGDFAQAYVLAHEVGHHVQTLLGISEEVHSLRSRVGETDANRLSVMQELQADCFAGLWAHHAHRSRQIIETGDIEEALNAASAIGDDRLQRQTRGHVTPDSFTHGSSAQRTHWFKRGLETGEAEACNTFQAENI